MSLSHFSMGETSDIVEVCHRLWKRSSSDPHHQSRQKYGGGKTDRNRNPRDRSRSRGGGGRHRDTSFRGDRNKGSDDKRKTSGPGHGDWKPRVESGPPLVLWKAVEEGDFDEVRRLLQVNDCDPDETHKLWTPLMKAAEEGNIQIATLLLDKMCGRPRKEQEGPRLPLLRRRALNETGEHGFPWSHAPIIS